MVKSIDKGKVGEREVGAILRAAGHAGARRGVQYAGGGDSPDVVGLPGFHIEVKRTEKFDLEGAMTQARRDAATDRVPVVVHRKSHKAWVAVLDFDKFLDLVKCRDLLTTMAAKQIDLPIVVKEQPDDSDYERLRRRVVELENELASFKDV